MQTIDNLSNNPQDLDDCAVDRVQWKMHSASIWYDLFF